MKLWKVSQYRGKRSAQYTGIENPIDLTPYIGDQGYVTTNKSLKDQAVGAFVIVFSDRASAKTRDSLYGLVAEMDYIEIRMAHDPMPAGQELPIVMRGFVNEIGTRQRMSDNGKPSRAVVIKGLDFTKLPGQMRIFYGFMYELGIKLLTKLNLHDRYGIQAIRPYSPPGDFYHDVLNKIVRPQLDKMWHASALASAPHNPWPIHEDFSVTEGAIFPAMFQLFQGTIWELFKQWSDKSWNELFLQDREDGVYLVYRPLPFRDINGRWLKGARDPGTVRITLADLVSQSLNRDDRRTQNYFWVLPEVFMLTGAVSMRAEALMNERAYILTGDAAANCNPDLFGIRPCEVKTVHGWTGQSKAGVDLPKEQQEKADGEIHGWAETRREELVAINKDNTVFERGTMTLFGNPGIRVGIYLELDYGAFTGSYYVTEVTQKFVPYAGYTTEVQVVRGTGWLARMAAPNSPYFGEREVGAYGG